MLITPTVLYHYEKEQGTTTPRMRQTAQEKLYHYEKEQGTTTVVE